MAVVAGATSVVHCSFITSLDGLTGDDPDAANDGSTGNEAATVDGGGSDSSSDSAPNDGAPYVDASPFCLNRDAAFCADFDGDGGLMSGWSGGFSDDASTSVLDTVAPVSAPYAYLSTAGPAIAGDYHQSYLYRNFTNIPPRVIVTFDLRVDHFASNDISTEAASLLLVGPIPNTAYSVQLNVGGSGSHIMEQIPLDAGTSTGVDHPLTKAILLGVWSHVVIDVVFSPGPRTVTVTLDGANVLDHAALAPNANPGPFRLLLGTLYCKGPSDGFAAHYDNVTVDTP